MKLKALIVAALFMLTSAQTFAAPLIDLNVAAPQLVATDDDWDDDDYDDEDYEDEDDDDDDWDDDDD